VQFEIHSSSSLPPTHPIQQYIQQTPSKPADSARYVKSLRKTTEMNKI